MNALRTLLLSLHLKAWRWLNPARSRIPLGLWWRLAPKVRVWAMTAAQLSQSSWQFYNDDGGEATATAVAAEETAVTLEVDTVYHWRGQINDTANGSENNTNFQLQYNLNGAGWNDVNGTSSVVQSAASQLVEGSDTTARLTVPTGGTFITPNAGQDEVDGVTGGPDIDFIEGTHDYVETVYSFQILSADVADADTIELRLVRGGGALLEDYTASPTPTITVSESGAAPQTIAVGAVTETETLQAVNVSSPVTVTVGAVTETETVQVVAPTQPAGGQSIAVGTVTEFETTTAWVDVGAVIETETAQTVTPTETQLVTVGTVTETETVQAVTATPGVVSVVVGAVTETEILQTVTPVLGGGAQTIAVGAVTETEAVQGITATPGVVTVAVGVVTETETAQVVSPVEGGAPQTVTVTTVTETETPQAVSTTTGAVTVTVGTVTETESVQPVTPVASGAPQTITVNAVTETETPQAVAATAVFTVTVGTVTETETVQAVSTTTGPVSIAVGTVTETETARSVVAIEGEKRRRLEGSGVLVGSTEGSKSGAGFLEGSKV